MFETGNTKVFKSNNSRIDKIVIYLSNKLKNNKSKNLIYILNIKTTGELIFLSFIVKKAFNSLK